MKYFSDKAENLENLEKLNLKNFVIPKFYFFDLQKWKNEKEKIIEKIIKNLNRKICIRSSFFKEDNSKSSMAGQFDSYININNEKKNLSFFIKKLILQYKNFEKKSPSLKNKVIVQNLINNSICSGVVTNYNLSDGAPYYTINYNNISNSTSSVTAGDKFSYRVLYVNRNSINKLRSKIFKNIILAVKKIEENYQYEGLDIEFAVTKNYVVNILQIRPLSTKKKWKPINENKFKSYLIKYEKKFNKISFRNKRYGKKAIFGLMPDWNPAEIIGFQPSKFSYSLYKKLVTNSVWAKAREEMGYNKVLNPKLIYSFSGKPYVDLRLSFHSLLPCNLSLNISNKINSYWINKLTKESYNHDKIEFEITKNCFYFGLKEEIDKDYDFLNKNEKKIFFSSLKNLTNNILENYENNFLKMNEDIILLENFRVNLIKKYIDNKKQSLNICKILLNKCENLGIKTFAKQARNAFIAKKILVSLVEKKILTKKTYFKILSNLNTISNSYILDKKNLENGVITKTKFKNKYYHLRPNSYDIQNKRYNSNISVNKLDDYTINNLLIFDIDKNLLSKKETNSLNSILKKENIKIDTKKLISFCIGSMKLRENYKYFFSRTLSDCIEILKNYHKKENSLKNLSKQDINSLLKKNNFKSKKGIRHDYDRNIKLPYLIVSPNDFYVSSILLSKPNFITDKKVQGDIVFVSKNIHQDIKNKIVVIENADPGFDWIFSKKIKGLITKYGGVNSHMSIRCEELQIPAIIGFGEDNYRQILTEQKIFFDCKNQKISVKDI